MKRTLPLTLLCFFFLFSLSAQISFDIAKEHLESSGKYTSLDLSDILITSEYHSDHLEINHLYLKQRFQGIEIEGSQTNFNIKNGEILSSGDRFFSNIDEKVNTLTPLISASNALQKVINRHQIIGALPDIIQEDNSSDKKILFDKGTIGHEDITVQLIFVPQEDELRLTWEVNFYEKTCQNWWITHVDANSGIVLDEHNQVIHCTFHRHNKNDAALEKKKLAVISLKQNAAVVANSYNVYAPPVESPNHGSRSLEISPWLDAGAGGTLGWHDDGTSTYTHTKGNNTDAYHDHDATNSPTGGNDARADGGDELEFDFSIDLTQDPESNPDPYITNLFYWSNLMHDVWYQYGFNEVAGNFQEDNQGMGGLGGDYLNSEAQDGLFTNNANFAAPEDGSNPRMQMFLWTPNSPTDPEIDSDLDNGVIAHEFGHGISIRLTGGPGDSGCLTNAEQGGEGWSDWLGLWMTTEAGDNHADSRGIGTYVSDEDVDGPGIRPAPYTTDFDVNNYTYGNVDDPGLSQPHGVGFVWCTMLWDLNWALIHNGGGLDMDLHDGSGGNNTAAQFIIDGMKIQPCNPGFVDARNAIIQASNFSGLTNVVWNVFARRGLGFSAEQGLASSRFDQIEAFDLPPGVPSMTYEELFGTGPLPVDLTFFNAVENNEKQNIELYWNTASETNNKGFDLQRKSEIEEVFESITWIDSDETNSFSSKNYSFNDQEVKLGVTYYYRLSQLDIDGTETFSDIVSAKLKSSDLDIQVFPNPTAGITSVRFSENITGVVEVKILDALGQFIGNKTFETRGEAEVEIDLTNQAKGIYFLNIETSGGSIIKRILLEE